MASKALLLLVPAAAAAVVASQWRELSRYLKLAQMSASGGNPQVVPVHGVQGYEHPGGGDSDGTGQFDSLSRGGGPIA